MKKQFVIKAAQALKNVTKSATKFESTNLLKFESATRDSVCCDYMPQFTGLSKPVFSL
ncbi:hypothetical protein [Spirosoma areae]